MFEENSRDFLLGFTGSVLGGMPFYVIGSIVLANYLGPVCDPPIELVVPLFIGLILVFSSIVASGNYAGKRDWKKFDIALGVIAGGVLWIILAAIWMIPMYGQLVLIPVCR